jgi:C-terminal processing protease CtpA/Prc
MIDYPRRMVYWEQELELDPHDLDQVGLTLETRDNERGYFVAAVARKKGRPTARGVEPGDKLLGIDGVLLDGATRGAIFSSLHGRPGAIHALTLERHGRKLKANVPVSAF